MEDTLGLVMTGGGARGAYQAGVLKRIGEIKRLQTQGNPFPIVGGSSAGAINGCAVAVGSDDFALATKVLARVWSELSPSDIFRCDVLSQAQNSLTWIIDLSFGALLGGGNAHSLFDATPLGYFLSKHHQGVPAGGDGQGRAAGRRLRAGASAVRRGGGDPRAVRGRAGGPPGHRHRTRAGGADPPGRGARSRRDHEHR